MFPVISALYVKDIIKSVMGRIWVIDLIERMAHMRNDKIFVDSLIVFLYSFHISFHYFSETNWL